MAKSFNSLSIDSDIRNEIVFVAGFRPVCAHVLLGCVFLHDLYSSPTRTHQFFVLGVRNDKIAVSQRMVFREGPIYICEDKGQHLMEHTPMTDKKNVIRKVDILGN